MTDKPKFTAIKKAFLFAFFLLLTGMNNGWAQSDMKFKHLTIDEGLSQNTAFCIFQDSLGFIWIGTEDGLNRFDGYEVRVFKNDPADPHSLCNNQVNTIVDDGRGRLLIGTANGLSVFDPETEKFTNAAAEDRPASGSDYITSVVVASDRSIWVGSYEGLSRFDPQTGRMARVAIQGSPKSVGRNKVQALFAEPSGKIWANIDNSLVCFMPQTGKLVAIPPGLSKEKNLIAGNIRVIRQDRRGNYWFGTERSGLFFYNRTTGICRNFLHHPDNKNSLPVNVVRDIFFNVSDGRIWIGTRKGLSILDTTNNHISNYAYEQENPDGLTHRSVLSLMKDNQGNIWIGTFAGGVNIFSPASMNFRSIKEKLGRRPGLSHRVVSSILTGKKGEIWAGTEGGGLNLIDQKNGSFKYYDLPGSGFDVSENIIKSLSHDRHGGLWVGTLNGLYHFDPASATFEALPITKAKGYPGIHQVYSLLVQNDTVWAGTNGGGLLLIKNRKIERVFLSNPSDKRTIVGNNITALTTDGGGRLWIGTERGLSILASGRFRQYTADGKAGSISSNNITSIFVDSRQRVWIGTRGGGLNLFNKGKNTFHPFTEKDGLSNNTIRAISEDGNGNLWVSSNKGISRLIIKTQPRLVVTVSSFTSADGLLSNQFLSGSVARASNGDLFFGSINGISSLNPQRMIADLYAPPVIIKELLIKNKTIVPGASDSILSKAVSVTKDLLLAFDQAYVTFRFTAFNYIHSEKNRYAYRLKGFARDDWHYVGSQNSATYTNLDAGNYIFEVKAASSEGKWGPPTYIRLKVLPPWYKSGWAIIAYAILIAGLLYLFHYLSLKTANLKNQLAFEYLSHQKDQELAERQTSFFTNISHEIKTPLTLILAPVEKILMMNAGNNKVQNQLMLMQRSGERLMRLINQLLDFRKFESGSMKLQVAEGNLVCFIKEILSAFQPYAKTRKVSIKLEAQRSDIPVWFDRDKLEKVISNLLSNAVKFSPPGEQILVSVYTVIEDQKEQVFVDVLDKGKGIAPEHLTDIFTQFKHYNEHGNNQQGTGIGLYFSTVLTELHQGKLTVESRSEEEGVPGFTRFRIALFTGKAHFRDEDIASEYKSSEDITGYPQHDLSIISEKIGKRKEKVLRDAQQEKMIMLIVEDNIEVANFISDHFYADFAVCSVANGLEGFKKANEALPDIIISDVMMPEMNGVELCSRLKNSERTSHIPVILLTARTGLFFHVEGLETGADDYITKPFNLNQLEARVWNLLEMRQKLRERYSREITLQPKNVAITSPDEKFIERVMHFIELNMDNSALSVEELGREVGMSQPTLYRKIKALTNQNTVEFIRSVRLKRAAQLLREDKFNVSEVAYMTGFTHLDYFRKCFKEQFGTTPSTYIRSANIDLS
jgi:ligand-binding sensor domain-containing protein/signal transduction histidine kinase/DNA-binding response OmpR family regulator